MKKAEELNLNSFIIDDKVQGGVATIAEFIIETSLKYKEDKNVLKPVCLLFGGEPTIKMTGKGVGGRNQHLALLTGSALKDLPGITFLSGGTDGTDGPTDATGAVVDSLTIQGSMDLHLDPEMYIANCDSYNFFRKVGSLMLPCCLVSNNCLFSNKYFLNSRTTAFLCFMKRNN